MACVESEVTYTINNLSLVNLMLIFERLKMSSGTSYSLCNCILILSI